MSGDPRTDYRAHKDETLQRANAEYAVDRFIKWIGLAALCAVTALVIYWMA
jgi:hypothetical protein